MIFWCCLCSSVKSKFCRKHSNTTLGTVCVNPLDILVLSWEVVWVGVQPLLCTGSGGGGCYWPNPARPVAHCLPLWETSGGPFPLLGHCSTNPPPTSRGERHTLAAPPPRPRPHSKKLPGKEVMGNQEKMELKGKFDFRTKRVI